MTTSLLASPQGQLQKRSCEFAVQKITQQPKKKLIENKQSLYCHFLEMPKKDSETTGNLLKILFLCLQLCPHCCMHSSSTPPHAPPYSEPHPPVLPQQSFQFSFLFSLFQEASFLLQFPYSDLHDQDKIWTPKTAGERI
jgi:hypothetical protein